MSLEALAETSPNLSAATGLVLIFPGYHAVLGVGRFPKPCLKDSAQDTNVTNARASSMGSMGTGSWKPAAVPHLPFQLYQCFKRDNYVQDCKT